MINENILFLYVGAATNNSRVDKLSRSSIEFELSHVTSFKRMTRSIKVPAHVIFILDGGKN